MREIIEVPDPRLKLVSEPVTEFDADLQTLVDDMFETMYDAPGIGLAAIQVAVPKRVLVIDLQQPDESAEPIVDENGDERLPVKNDPRVYINPELFNLSEDMATYQEGCLSIPEIYGDVLRPASCSVRFQDVKGEWHEESMDGLLATCLQHEIDHLNGVLFIDHMSRLKRNMMLKKLKKLRQAA